MKNKLKTDRTFYEVTAGSYVYLDGKQGINLSSGRDEFHAKGRQTGYGVQVGVGAQVGAQTGAYAFAELGYNNAKQQTDINNKLVHHPKATAPSVSEVFKAAYHNLTNPRNMVNVQTLPTDNTDMAAELLTAVYQKWFKSGDNSVRQAEILLKDYGNKGLFVGSHSRGTLTVSNALQRLDSEENKGLLAKTKMKMVGPATDVTRADNILNRLQGKGEVRQSREGSILVENSKYDAIGSWWIIGGNPYTTETKAQDKNSVAVLRDIFGDNSSSHNCYGLGQRQCVKDGYRKEGDLVMHPEKTIFELNQMNKEKR